MNSNIIILSIKGHFALVWITDRLMGFYSSVHQSSLLLSQHFQLCQQLKTVHLLVQLSFCVKSSKSHLELFLIHFSYLARLCQAISHSSSLDFLGTSSSKNKCKSKEPASLLSCSGCCIVPTIVVKTSSPPSSIFKI